MSNTQTRFIAVLRGINVSGKNMIKMPNLVKTFEDLGFADVNTYLQSGNILFRSGEKNTDWEQKIRHQIDKDFGLSVPVIVFSHEYLQRIREENPFTGKTGIDQNKLHVTFLSEEPSRENFEKIKAEQYLPDEFILRDKVIYLFCPAGYGNTKLHNNFFENKLKVMATTRNWNTVNKLAELG